VMFRYQDIIRRNMVNTKFFWTVKCNCQVTSSEVNTFCLVETEIFYCVASFYSENAKCRNHHFIPGPSTCVHLFQ
jgi:hypothetical protein